jgi:hypothetical protein
MISDTWLFITKMLISVLVIAGASTLSQRSPVLAGYIVALPLTSILVLSFAYAQSGDGAQTAKFAISILAALPMSLLFFAPFLLYGRLKGPFWAYMLVGIGLLYVGFFVQRAIAARLIG